MWGIGVIKWFDISKGFGFIPRLSHPTDVFVHQSQLKCPVASLTEGTFVTYLFREEPKNKPMSIS
jgi:cold shock CspA family protein